MRVRVSDVDLWFGLNLRTARMAAGMNHEQLGEQADLSGRVVQMLERGETRVRLSVALRLARLFGMTVEDLSSPPIPTRASS